MNIFTDLWQKNTIQSENQFAPFQLTPSDFQEAIKEGNIEIIKKSIAEGLSVNDLLPNGELPLHFAICTNNQDAVQTLLEYDANPDIKNVDDGLNAIDLAILVENKNLLACILAKKMGKELKEVEKQLDCKITSEHINVLKTKIQDLVKTAAETPYEHERNAYKGELDKLKAEHLPHYATLIYNKGFRPIHFAILGNQPTAIEQLFNVGTKIDTLDDENNSLLHFAVVCGSKKIINTLIDKGVDVNHQNSNGETALHFAAAKDDLSTVELLIKKGADICIHDNNGVSPLAMIGNTAKQRDPLNLPRTQMLLFTTLCLAWVTNMLATGEGIFNPAVFLTALGVQIAEMCFLIPRLENTWQKVTALIMRQIPVLSLGVTTLTTYHIVKSAFEGIKSSWRGLNRCKWKASRNMVVYSVNTALSSYFLFKQYKLVYDAFNFASEAFTKVRTALAVRPEESENPTNEEVIGLVRILVDKEKDLNLTPKAREVLRVLVDNLDLAPQNNVATSSPRTAVI